VISCRIDGHTIVDLAHTNDLKRSEFRDLTDAVKTFQACGAALCDVRATSFMLNKAGKGYIVDFDRATLEKRGVANSIDSLQQIDLERLDSWAA
jgi:hypothetical protein